MLPSLSLVILGSLLAQSAQGNDSPQAIITFSAEQLQDLVSAQLERRDIRGRLQNLPLHDTLKNGMKQQNKGGLFPIFTGIVNSVLGNILEVRTGNVELPKPDLRFDQTAKQMLLTVPADMEVKIFLPWKFRKYSHSPLRAQISTDVQAGVQMLRNPTDNSMQLVVGNCSNNPGHLRMTALEDDVNNILGPMADVALKTFPSLLQKELCPLVNGALQSVVQLLQGSPASEVRDRTIQLTPMSYALQNGALELDYQGVVRLPEGQTWRIPPGPSPLLPAPLDGSPMNILLSGNLLNALLGARLPPQAISLNPQEVAVFSRAEALRAAAPTAANIRALQISHGFTTLTVDVGSIQAQQAIEVKAFGDYQGRTAQLFALKADVHLSTGVAAVGGKLILTLALGRIDNPSVISSLAQPHRADPKSLMEPIAQLVSGSLLPRQNQLLNEGFQLPMARELGVSTFGVAAGQDALKLSAPPHSAHVPGASG